MCVAVPMRIVRFPKPRVAEVELDGLVCEINVALLPQAQVGDYVLVHAGVAIEKIRPEAAAEQQQLFAELTECLQEQVQ